MPVAGLTITLAADEALASNAITEMSSQHEIVLGRVDGRYMAAVMDTPSPSRSRDLHGWIESLAGVDYLDVVYVGFDPDPPDAPAPQPPISSTLPSP